MSIKIINPIIKQVIQLPETNWIVDHYTTKSKSTRKYKFLFNDNCAAFNHITIDMLNEIEAKLTELGYKIKDINAGESRGLWVTYYI